MRAYYPRPAAHITGRFGTRPPGAVDLNVRPRTTLTPTLITGDRSLQRLDLSRLVSAPGDGHATAASQEIR